MRYALFLGCTVPVRAMNYELSARKVAEVLGIEFIDMEDALCCGFPVKSINREASIIMAARNLALAEKQGLNICTLCSACTSVLTEVNKVLIEDEELREIINKKMGDIAYNGKVEVKHFSRILYEDFGVDRLKTFVERPLEGIKLAAHYGCHYLKPSEIYDGFDDPEQPKSLDLLIELTGAESVMYQGRGDCCGGAILGVEEEIALKMTKKKLDHVKAVGADAMISICPFCSVMYEGNQKKIEKEFDTKYGLPVLYYPQLLGLALGISPDELGFKLNRVKAKGLLAKLNGEKVSA